MPRIVYMLQVIEGVGFMSNLLAVHAGGPNPATAVLTQTRRTVPRTRVCQIRGFAGPDLLPDDALMPPDP